MTDIDAVAEAIRSAIIEQLKRRQDWYASPPAGYLVSDGVQKTPDELAVDGSFELMPVAQAAIDALHLTQEWAYVGNPYDEGDELDEWTCGHTIITATRHGQVHEGFDRPVCRLVSPWVRVEEQP